MPLPHAARKRPSRILSLALAATLTTSIGLAWTGTGSTAQAAPATVSGCSYGTFGASQLLNNVCWFNTSGWNFSGGSVKRSVQIGNYTLSFTATSVGADGYTAGSAPIWPGASLGHSGGGVGIPVFFKPQDDRGTAGSFTIRLTGLSLTGPGGTPAGDWGLVMADAESTNKNGGANGTSEEIHMSASNGVSNLLGSGMLPAISDAQGITNCTITGSLGCVGAGGNRTGAIVGYSKTPSSASITLKHNGGSGQGGAFGIMLPQLQVSKALPNGLSHPSDSFQVKVNNGTVDQFTTSRDATTGSSPVGIGVYTIEEIAANRTTNLAAYNKSIQCVDEAGLNLDTAPAANVTKNDGTGLKATVRVGFGQKVHCTIVNTAIPTTLTLNKKVVGRATATDTFQVGIDQGKQPIKNASTGSANWASTGEMTVLAGLPYTLSDRFVNDVKAADYLTDLTCTNATKGSATKLPSGAVTSASVTPAIGDQITCTFTNTAKIAKLDVVKSASTTATKAGDVITYNFTVTNVGNITIKDVTLADPKCDAGTLTPTAAVDLAPEGIQKYSCTKKVTQAEADAGQVLNTAKATGTRADRPTTVEQPSNQVTTPIASTSSLGLVKTHNPAFEDVNGNGLLDGGDKVTYSFVAENTGTKTLTGVTLSDDRVGVTGRVCTPSTLSPGAKADCGAAVYTIPAGQADGKIVNTATVEAKDPKGAKVSTTAKDSITIVNPKPSIRVTKSVNGDNTRLVKLGEQLTYTFLVANTGNMPLTNILVSDKTLGIKDALCYAGPLAPGAEAYCVQKPTYNVQQSDVDAGVVENTVIVSATRAGSTTPVKDDDTHTIKTVAADPKLTLVKSHKPAIEDVNKNGIVDAGDKVTYTFSVENTGNVTVKAITLTDNLIGHTAACTPSELKPGEKGQCSEKVYALTKAQQDAGTFENKATATGLYGSTEVPSNESTDTVTLVAPKPGMTLAKTATLSDKNGNGVADVGEFIEYTFAVTNTGNVPLANVTITDTMLGMDGALCVAELGVKASLPCEAKKSYEVKQTTIDAAKVIDGKPYIVNEALAKADVVGGGSVSAPGNAKQIVGEAAPALEVKKTASVADVNKNGINDAGDVVTYSFSVRNTGNVTLNNVVLTDELLWGTDAKQCLATLAPGNDWVPCTMGADVSGHPISEAQAKAGSFINTVIANATPTRGTVKQAEGKVTVVTAVSTPSLVVTKSVQNVTGGKVPGVGDELVYTFEIKNTGNVPLSTLTVNDEMLAKAKVSISFPADFSGTLAPNAVVKATARYLVSQADVDNGIVENVATATGTPPTGDPVTSPPSKADQSTDRRPAIAVVKKGILADTNRDGNGDPGEKITYEVTITNTGTTTVKNVAVSDPMLAKAGIALAFPAGFSNELLPGESVVAKSSPYTISVADMATGALVNTATGTADAPRPSVPSAQDVTKLSGTASFTQILLEDPVGTEGGDPTPDPVAPKPAGDKPTSTPISVVHHVYQLAMTGGPGVAWAVAGLGLLLAGLLALMVARRRRGHSGS